MPTLRSGEISFLVILALGFAPGIFWLWYLYRRDKWEPEPKSLVARAFFLGMLAVIPALLLELPFQILGSKFLLIVIAAPIVEELVKFFFVKKFIYNKAEFDEPMDGIVYAAAVALGFAAVENVFYLASAKSAVMTVFAGRAILSVPGHALFSSMWGYALGLAKFSPPERGRKLLRNGLIFSILTHGIFNFLGCFTLLGGLGVLVFVAVLWWILLRRIARVERESPFKEEGVD